MANYKKVLAGATAALLSAGVFAQESASGDDVIVVTAAKVEQKAEDTVEKVTIITALRSPALETRTFSNRRSSTTSTTSKS